jgi:DtxR family Mn-dependent transcriptional regulator
MQHPTEDPHGHPIPDAKGRLVKRSLLPLAALPRGARAKVCEIDDENAPRLARWREIGLVPGAAVYVREVRPLDGVVELVVSRRRYVTSTSSLEGIRVQLARGGPPGS